MERLQHPGTPVILKDFNSGGAREAKRDLPQIWNPEIGNQTTPGEVFLFQGIVVPPSAVHPDLYLIFVVSVAQRLSITECCHPIG